MRSTFRRWVVAVVSIAAVLGAAADGARAQDFYDTTVLRNVALNFHDANWLQLLRQNYASQTNILADMVVEGVTYPDVGVRIRGNTSYTALPPGSDKFSLNVDVDFVHADQNVMGYKGLNFNNGFHDPTFCREVVYSNFVAQFIPNPRANHITLTLSGENWGVYVNVQQFDKTMLGPHFPDAGGLRIKCANNPNGPGLKYNGENPAGYTGYEIKDDGGFADPWPPHIDVCDVVTNGSLTTWQNIDFVFAIDPSIWSVVLENMLTDDDSYVNKGADFMTYRNPTDGRTFLLQTDANETFTQATWSPTMNFTSPTKPVLSHVLSVAELRQRYMSHYRAAKVYLNWPYFEPIFDAHRALIDAAVQADPKKLYTYAQFQTNFTGTVILPYPGPAGGTLIGIRQFVDQRLSYLNGQPELVASAPTINSVTASDSTPDPGQPPVITANVSPGTTPIAKVELFYRPSPTGLYQRILMSSAGGGNYRVTLPVTGVAGQKVLYYVAATSANSYASVSYSPVKTEWAPLEIEFTFVPSGGMRITEWMYSGVNGEFIEFTNVSSEPVNMFGWSFDDDHNVPGAFSLSAYGVVQPGEAVILTESLAATFRTAWGLAEGVDIIGELGVASGNNLARNDVINLYDQTGALVDRLSYGDQTYPGSIRTQNASGQACAESIGRDNVIGWTKSASGDSFGSFSSSGNDKGTPGLYRTGWSALGEVGGLGFASDKATLAWNPLPYPAIIYDVPRGLVAEFPVGTGPAETCVVPGGTVGTSVTDATVPGAGTAFWYLVRGRNLCGGGSYGAAYSPGTPWHDVPRTPAACP